MSEEDPKVETKAEEEAGDDNAPPKEEESTAHFEPVVSIIVREGRLCSPYICTWFEYQRGLLPQTVNRLNKKDYVPPGGF